MKKRFLRFLSLSLLICMQITYGQDLIQTNENVVEFTSSNLPIVVIDTHGQVIPNDEKITADMGIIFNGSGIRNNLTDPFNNYNGKIGIELRGSSSQMFPKKQYAVETRDISGEDSSVSLLGFPKESDWILFAPYNDKSLMRDVLAYKISNLLGRYASRSMYCELVLNGDYKGVYVLLEKVKRDANRVNIKKLEPGDISGDALTGGYIIKIDKTDGEDNDGWYSGYYPFPGSPVRIFYQYHYPRPSNIVLQQKNYIQNKIYQFETMMSSSSNISDSATGYPKYLDVSSFAEFFLVNEFSKNVDAYRLSTYLYKDRDSRNPRMFAGPVWDFNLAFGNADYYNGWATDNWELEYLTNYQNMFYNENFFAPFWWRKLFDDQNFQNKVYARWQQAKVNVFNTQVVNNLIDSLVVLLDEAKTRNFLKWSVLGVWVWPNYYVGQTYTDEINYLKNWISARLEWMDNNMIGEPTFVNQESELLPKNFILQQNYPNPFNPATNIKYAIDNKQFVTLKVYDVLGNEVATLIDEYKPAGNHNVIFDASKFSSGVYFYQLKTGEFIQTRKMILNK
ncbi:MAG: CotH kinase family protein [Ignavibacterium sp.]|nr:CotH kinase family protein [Ignavibacterium sp.]